MKQISGNIMWKGNTSNQIAIAIAKKYKMKYVVDATFQKWKEEPQANKSDFAFLQMLVKREPGFIFYIQNNTLYFVKRNYSKTPIVKYTYGEGLLMSFKVAASKSIQEPASNDVKSISIDPLSGNVVTASATDKLVQKYDQFGDEAGEGKEGNQLGLSEFMIGGTKVDFNPITATVSIIKTATAGDTPEEDVSGSQKVLSHPSGDKTEMQAMASATQANAANKVITASYEMIGDPHLEINELITIGGIGKRYGGNWFISEAVDEISGDSYFKTTGKVTRDGTAKPIMEYGNNNKDVNKKEGKDITQKPSKTIPVYDENGANAGTKGSDGTW